MNLLRYTNFSGFEAINEDLNKAKKLLKDRHIIMSAAKELGLIKGEIEQKLKDGEIKSVKLKDFSPEEQREIIGVAAKTTLADEVVRGLERDPDFAKIKEISAEVDVPSGKKKYVLGSSNLGWLYMFTYFYYMENIPVNELEMIYKKLIENKDILQNLTVAQDGSFVAKAFDVNFINTKVPNNSELLDDGLDRLEQSRKAKKIEADLPPALKADLKDSPLAIKQQFDEIAFGFDMLGKDKDGKTDQKKKEKLYKGFFGQMMLDTRQTKPDGSPNPTYGKMVYSSSLRRYTNIREFIKAAADYLKACENEGISTKLDEIQTVKEQLGENGADMVFNNNGIIIIEVKSFVANQRLNSHTSHCIKDRLSQWESYVSNHYNKQYYIYNFNIPQYDNMSTIGITIEPGKKIRAAHNKPDHNIAGTVKSTLDAWSKQYGVDGSLWDYLEPMTPEEIEKREKAKAANREIVKRGKTIEEIRRYVIEDGADINKDGAKALEWAVAENDLAKANAIIALGGNPMIRPKSDPAIINSATSLDMIKLLVKSGSELTRSVFNNICHDVEAVEFCLKNGLDPNFDNSLPIRRSCKGSWKSIDDIGEGYLETFELLVKYGTRLSDERGRYMIIKWASEYGRADFIDYVIEKGAKTGFAAAYSWLGLSRKISLENRKEMAEYLVEKMEQFEPEEWANMPDAKKWHLK